MRRIGLVLAFSFGCQTSAKTEPVSSRLATVSSAPVVMPTDELDRLDARKPLPLLPMMAHHQKQSMREHLEAVQQVVAAAAGGDFGAVEAAAKRLGSSPAMGQMCQHLGVGAPGFTERALAFHRTADRITEAAAARDLHATLSALGETLAACTACHATYKQQLVTSLE